MLSETGPLSNTKTTTPFVVVAPTIVSRTSPCTMLVPPGAVCVPKSSVIRWDPRLPGALHPGARVGIDIGGEPPVELDVERTRRPALPLAVGDSSSLADNGHIPGANVPQQRPGSVGVALDGVEQAGNRCPSFARIGDLRQAQRRSQTLRIVPVIEQVLRRRIAARVSSEGGRDRTLSAATAATATARCEDRKGRDCSQNTHRHEKSPGPEIRYRLVPNRPCVRLGRACRPPL